MNRLESLIRQLKLKTKRENFIFMRRRVAKGNGKKTLGWILKKENSNETMENIDFYKLYDEKEKL